MTVVDASVAARWLFDLPGADRAEAFLASGERLIAPDLVIAEVTNAAWKSVRFGETPVESAVVRLQQAGKLFDELVPSIELKDRAFAIAVELQHPAYDCFYLALGELRGVAIVTADDRLLRRCAGTRFEAQLRSL